MKKKAFYIGMENHQDHYLKTIAKERLEISKYFDRYVIVGVLKGNKEEDYNMDYDTFLSFFDKLREEKDIKIGDYKVRYNESLYNLTSGSIETISYYRDGYMIGEDYIKEYYKLGDIMPTLDTSFDISGIKNYAKLKDYLDYLYETNIEELKRQEREREQELLERQREEELKEKKLNYFLDI